MAAKGSVKFTIGADASGLGRGLRGAEKHMKAFGERVEGLGKFGGSGLGGVAAGLVSIGGAAEFVRESATATMDLYKSSVALSRVTGFDTQQSSAWVNIAKERGISTEILSRSYTTLAKQIRSAQQGGSQATKTFAALGVSQKDLRSGDTAAIMGKIADSLKSHADGSGKAAVASQLFGRSYSAMLGILNKGSGGVKKLVDEQIRHGAVLGKNTRDLAKARESQLRFTMAMEKLKVTIGQAVLPYMIKLSDKLSSWLDKAGNKKKVDELVGSFSQLGRQAVAVGNALLPVINGVGRFIKSHSGLVKIIADVVAFRAAVKLISFAVPLKGLAGFAGKVLGLKSVGIRAGAGLATGIASKFPALAKWMASAFEKLGAQMGWRFASRFGAMLRGNELGKAAGGGGLLASIFGGLKSVGKFALGAATSAAGLVASGAAAFGVTFNSFADDGTDKEAGLESDLHAFTRSRGMYGGKRYSSFDAWRKAKRAGARGRRAAGVSMNDSLGSIGGLPDFTFSGGSSAPASPKATALSTSKSNSPDQILAAAVKLAQWSHTYDEKLTKLSNSLWTKGIDPNSPAGLSQKSSVLSQAVAAWPKIRAALAALARQANAAEHYATTIKICDYVHRGDLKQLEYRAHFGQAKSRMNSSNPVPKAPSISGAQMSEEAFIRAAFAPGDIGSGGLNAFLAAGGVPTGLNSVAGSNSVNITIQSLHPGDGQTKAAIAQSVVASLQSQSKKPRVRTTVGAK